jgi:hypothetical protein
LTKSKKKILKANEYSPPYHALRDLGLVGAQLEGQDFSGYSLRGVNFTNANLRAVNFANADLTGAIFTRADLSRACLHLANCTRAKFDGADLTMTYGRGTLFFETSLTYCMLRRVTYKNCFFLNCNMEGADLAQGFFVGSKFNGSITKGMKNADPTRPGGPVFTWYLRPGGGPPRYEPAPQYLPYNVSVTGSLTVQENAARRKIA